MQSETSEISTQVLKFYRELPFNLYGAQDAAVASITKLNQVQHSYPDLHRVLLSGTRTFLDLGCGAGWLSNTVARYYNLSVTGVDFNSVAIEAAKETSSCLETGAVFKVANLFEPLGPEAQYDVVASIGVLHHTGDAHQGIRILTQYLSFEPNARVYLGLYHHYGRKPFLQLFQQLKEQGASEAELFQHYQSLHSDLLDETHLRSWFRDQVLHPHETQHTLMEIVDVLSNEGFQVESTSINGFEEISDLSQLFQLEKEFEGRSYQRNIVEKRYFPGFFTVCAKRR